MLCVFVHVEPQTCSVHRIVLRYSFNAQIFLFFSSIAYDHWGASVRYPRTAVPPFCLLDLLRLPLMNAINVISPYKYLDMWVFDDPRVGLVQEPFVGGADTIIDKLVADIPNAQAGFMLIFSSAPFPGHQWKLFWSRGESGGNWYHCPDLGLEGWLCPALFRYFEQAPAKLYVQVKPKAGAAGGSQRR